jgi:hypothetical protein
LLAAVNGVERVVDVERDPLGNRSKRLAVEIDQGATHPHQRAGVRQVLQSRYRRLRAQFAIRRRQIERHLEHRIAAQAIGVDPVLVARANHQNAKPDDIRQAVGDLLRRPRIRNAPGQPIGHPKPLLDFPQRQQAAVRRQQPAVEFDLDPLARNRRQTGQRQHRILHGEGSSSENATNRLR